MRKRVKAAPNARIAIVLGETATSPETVNPVLPSVNPVLPSVNPVLPSVNPVPLSVIPMLPSVIPAKAGIQGWRGLVPRT